MISAVNTILSAIALWDLILNIVVLPMIISHLLSDSRGLPYYWALLLLVASHITFAAHTISMWLTCALAIWRYCVVW